MTTKQLYDFADMVAHVDHVVTILPIRNYKDTIIGVVLDVGGHIPQSLVRLYKALAEHAFLDMCETYLFSNEGVLIVLRHTANASREDAERYVKEYKEIR